jgi:uncharacterized membrane protein YbhN (UPF0104 family)
MNRQRLGSLVGAAIGLAGVAFVVRRMVRDWDDVSTAMRSADPLWVGLGVVFGLVAMGTIGWNWLVLLRPADTASVARSGSAWFFVGQLGKYVPGGIWPIVGQAELATRAGSARAVSYSATALSMLATLLAAASVAVVAAVGSPFDERSLADFDHRPLAVGVGAILLVGFMSIGAAPVRRRVREIVEWAVRRRLELPGWRTIGLHTGRHLPVWFCFSMVNVSVARAIGVPLEARVIVELAAATCIAWIAGFVVVGLPGGIGVREAVFVSLMTGPVGASVAVSIAVVSRAVSIAVDLLGAAGAVAINGVPRRNDHRPV